jgi:hypothetical protein
LIDRRLALAGGASLFVVALALRLIGISYGLPAVYNPDEVAIMSRALSFAKGTLNPHNFLYPTFYFYVLFAWVGVFLGLLLATGRLRSIAAARDLYFTDPTGIYIAGRVLSAVSGAATVLLVHRLGSRLFDARTATAAAVFLAVAPLHVRDSHYVKHDVFAALLVVFAYLAITRVWPTTPRPGGVGRVATAGAACGVAFSTHYYCIFLALPLTWAIVQAWRTEGVAVVAKHLVLAAMASAVTFFALSPFLAVEPLTAWRDITANREIVVDRAVAAGAFAPFKRYVDLLWNDALSRPVMALAVAGAAWTVVKDWQRAVLLLAFPLAFFAFISNTFPASRYLNPVLPFLVLFAAAALTALASHFKAQPWMFWTAVAAFAVGPAVSSIRTDLFFRQTDTRTLAREFIEREIPPSATVLIQPYSVPLTPSRENLVEALTRNVGGVEAASTKFQLQLGLDPYPAPAYRLIYLGRGGLDADKLYVDPATLADAPVARLRRLGVAFVVLKRYNTEDPDLMPLLTALSREARRMAAFSPYRSDANEYPQERPDPFLHNTDARIDGALARPGPTVEIWQLHDPGS